MSKNNFKDEFKKKYKLKSLNDFNNINLYTFDNSEEETEHEKNMRINLNKKIENIYITQYIFLSKYIKEKIEIKEKILEKWKFLKLKKHKKKEDDARIESNLKLIKYLEETRGSRR